jgi:hypothetical protein
VQVIGHNYPSINLQAFLFLAVFQAVYNNIAILRPRENINPLCNGSSNEVDALLVSDFICKTHIGLIWLREDSSFIL